MKQLTKEQELEIARKAGEQAIIEARNEIEGIEVMKPFRQFALRALLINTAYKATKKNEKKGIEIGDQVHRTMLNIPLVLKLLNNNELTKDDKVFFKAGGWGTNQTIELEEYDEKYSR
tara:strand:+ start:267 stop:620 length:354 start_codon:yes stop_codon:yes gene_type:complete